MMKRAFPGIAIAASLALTPACVTALGPDSGTDAFPGIDSNVPGTDANVPGTDSGSPGTDSGPPPTTPEWCIYQFPTPLVSVTGWPSPLAYGRVFATGLTDAAGAAPGIDGEIGFGPLGSAPDGTWTWSASAWAFDVDSNVNDEHIASVTVGSPGSYQMVYRFSRDGMMTWLSCDLDGNDGTPGGFDPAAANILFVEDPPGGDADWCNLQFPTAVTVSPGAGSENIFGQLFEPGLTDAVTPIRGMGVIAEVGFGPDGGDPTMDITGWSFFGGRYNVDVGFNDEYGSNIIVPPGTAPGSYDFAYRVSLDGGATFTYCDSDGNDTNTGGTNGYDPAMAGDLTVP